MTDVARVPSSVDVLRQQVAPGATDAELAYFGQVCQHLDLDFFRGEICLIGRNQKVKDDRGHETWQKVHKPQIQVAGRRVLAARTGQLQGIDGPVWCGPRVDGDVWSEVWDGAGEPYAARVLVYRQGWVKPANGTVKWSEFAQYTDRDRTNLAPLWVTMPSHMLGKVAESLALRRAFSDVIPSGAVEEEFATVDTDTGEIPPHPELAGPAPGPAFATSDPDGSRKYSESQFGRNRAKPPLPVPPPAAEPPPGRPTIPRPPAAPKPDNNVWHDGTPMFDPQTGKPI